MLGITTSRGILAEMFSGWKIESIDGGIRSHEKGRVLTGGVIDDKHRQPEASCTSHASGIPAWLNCWGLSTVCPFRAELDAEATIFGLRHTLLRLTAYRKAAAALNTRKGGLKAKRDGVDVEDNEGSV